LVKLQPFEQWFVSVIIESNAIGEEVVEDALSISAPPSNLSTCRSMYAFGNHL
jgi:hypothetical protein